MRYSFGVLLIWLFCNASGQSLEQIEALGDDYYKAGQYQQAAEYFQYVYDSKGNDRAVQEKLALSLMHSLELKKALSMFEGLVNEGASSDSIFYFYGYLLKINGLYSKADSIFGIILEDPTLSPDLREVASFQREGCLLEARFSQTRSNYELAPLDQVNSSAHDFGLINYQEKFILSSTRNTKEKQYYDGQFGGLLPDIIAYEQRETGFEQISDYKKLNSPWSEGVGCFSGDDFYYTYCEGGKDCQIIKSVMVDGKWKSEPLGEKINKPGYDSKHPNLSQTGDTLYFISNRPGGQGGTDLWMSFKMSETEWGPAVNLGAAINTAGDEMSPFYHSGVGGLVFASNGHVGYGGFDLYIAKGSSILVAQVYNLGPPFNSSYDDCYFTTTESQAFISSNRVNNQFDVFFLQHYNDMELMNSFLAEKGEVGVKVAGLVSMDLYSFRFEEYEGYHILHPEASIVMNKKQQSTEFVASSSTGGFQMVSGSGTPGSPLKVTYSDSMQIEAQVDENGRYLVKMIPGNAVDIKVSGDNVSFPIVQPMSFDGYEYNFDRLYFDFNSVDLRREAREVLDELIQLFVDDDLVLIDIKSHADQVGDDTYNYRLSERRGASILQYLSSRGVDESKLRITPKGEKELLSNQNSWYTNLFNRRATIVVYTNELVDFARPEVFIVRRTITVPSAAQMLGVDAGKLRVWNKIPPNQRMIPPGEVLRVFDPVYFSPNYYFIIPEEMVGKQLITYVVRNGETLEEIASRFGVVEEVIAEMNHLGTRVEAGKELVIYKY
ncbi:OmpA family protein [Marinoscillum pacificum]|uniref:OmpA family protein n=1 Tax=Marinoscillum pacificum TaxID=392723 RepID=UPI002157B458|nr:OmpA family protein [Marinoscillum pacificum]